MANSVDPDQTAPIGAVCSGSTLFPWSEMLGNYLQQTPSADNIFRCIFFLGALRVKLYNHRGHNYNHFILPTRWGLTMLLFLYRWSCEEAERT